LKIDWSDLGNLILAVGGSLAVFATTMGKPELAAIIGAVALVGKGICSAVDNYLFKASQIPT